MSACVPLKASAVQKRGLTLNWVFYKIERGFYKISYNQKWLICIFMSMYKCVCKFQSVYFYKFCVYVWYIVCFCCLGQTSRAGPNKRGRRSESSGGGGARSTTPSSVTSSSSRTKSPAVSSQINRRIRTRTRTRHTSVNTGKNWIITVNSMFKYI